MPSQSVGIIGLGIMGAEDTASVCAVLEEMASNRRGRRRRTRKAGAL